MKLDLEDINSLITLSFFDYVAKLQSDWDTNNVIFCFDCGYYKRTVIYNEYKISRAREGRYTADDILKKTELVKMIETIRNTYLTAIGFKNVFYQKGYEADDIMASVSNALPDKEFGVLVTADEDMFQCIKKNVMFFNPSSKKKHNEMSFKREYGIYPKQWGMVKSVAGCLSDNVEGVKGVGIKTAIKFIKFELKLSSVVLGRIMSLSGQSIIKRNKALVVLPFDGTRTFSVSSDELDYDGWEKVMEDLGINSQCPFIERKRKPRLIYG